jgi:glucose/arabinose dehydrogenase
MEINNKLSDSDDMTIKRAAYLCLILFGFVIVNCGKPPPLDSGASPRVGLELVAKDLTAPLTLAAPDDGSGRLIIADQDGLIWLLNAEGQRLKEPFLDLRNRMVDLRPSYDERGLLGFTLHPDFVENGRFFVYYSAPLRPDAPAGWDHTSHLSEFRLLEGNPDRADPDSERIILQVDQPQSNHNGSQIAFGPDGFLYVALGDGGGANDAGSGHSSMGNAQDTSTLLGSVLRLDVDKGDPYGIPDDNPLVGQPGRDEIWAYGLRNPFRIAFDLEGEGQLYTGDVGQNIYEEIDILVGGGNYGWNIREGQHCFDPAQPGAAPDQCPESDPNGEPLQAPILEYDHDLGIAVIGGFVYRGSQIPALQGHYIFGDWSTSFAIGNGKIFDGVPPASQDAAWTMRPVIITTSSEGVLGAYLLSFGQDAEGELYIMTSDWPGPTGSSGKVYRLIASP